MSWAAAERQGDRGGRAPARTPDADAATRRDEGAELAAGVPLFDAHCHLDLFDDPVAVARGCAELGVGVLSMTVTPAGYDRWATELGAVPGVRVAVGLHPWWLADGRAGAADVERLLERVGEVGYVGEVGVDLSPARLGPQGGACQLEAFRRIAGRCAEVGGRVLSIHAVRAAGAVVDVLEETGCADSCACVLHWFSGSGDELVRARRAGLWFSVGERSLSTRRGRAYARQYPRDRLLLETDLPPAPATSCGAADVRRSLGRALLGLERARGERLADTLADNARRLLS